MYSRRTAETDAAFAFHHVNAYETANDLIVDIVTFADADIIDQFYLTRLRAAAPIDGTGRLTRYTISFARNGKARPEPIADVPIELPRIHYARHAGKDPMYVVVIAVILGQAILFGDWRLLVYGALFWLACHAFVVSYEEPTLERTFGAEYEAYRANTPRWIPRITPRRNGPHCP